jgi:glycosyltransferase EpsE
MISVLLPVFNPDIKNLVNCLNGICKSNYKNLEIIIIADLSAEYIQVDKLDCLINSFKHILDIIFIKRIEKKGIASALNLGIQMSRGDFIARIDADDISYENRFSLQINEMKKYNATICYGLANSQDNKILGKKMISGNEINDFTFQNPIIHPSVMFRKKDIIKIGAYNEDLDYCEDLDLWFRCIKSRLKFVCIGEPVIMYTLPENGRHNRNWITNIVVRFTHWKVLGVRRLIIGVTCIFLYLLLPQNFKSFIYSRFTR